MNIAHYLELQGMKKGRLEGQLEGMDKGRLEGKKKGRRQATLSIATHLLARGVDCTLIKRGMHFAKRNELALLNNDL